MQLINWLPPAIYYMLILLGIVAVTVLPRLPLVPHKHLFALAATVVVLFSAYALGSVHNNQQWQARVHELEAKVAAAETRSQQVNIEVRDRIVVKTNTIREQGKNIVEYVDREVVKYDSRCTIPQEVVDVHNQAAKVNK